MKQVCLLLLILVSSACGSEPARNQKKQEPVIEAAEYEGRPHFLIRTRALDYYYDIRGGGFSRIIDSEGNDWVSFRMKPWGSYPASAAAAYRGLPNLVFQEADDGAGHPGHDKCRSHAVANRITSISLSGLWEWTWEFFDSYAILEITRSDPGRAYWFLYEGTPGGSFSPDDSYFGTDKGGPHRAAYDYSRGEVLRGDFRWIYAGNAHASGTLFILQEQEDELLDMISYLGNTEAGTDSPDGMTVFGFGRDSNATPLLKGSQRFIIGLYPERIQNAEAHERLGSYVKNFL